MSYVVVGDNLCITSTTNLIPCSSYEIANSKRGVDNRRQEGAVDMGYGL